MRRELVAVNPTREVDLPAARGKRERIATAAEAVRLLDALPDADRPIWATAFYAGLRRGELQALRACDIDLARGEIAVQRSWDQYEGPVAPKSKAGTRTVPILGVLRDRLSRVRIQTGPALVFGRTDTQPFAPKAIARRAARAWWSAEDERERSAAGEQDRAPSPLAPITLHECRHTFASLLIDAGVNPKAIQEFMGHATIEETFSRYGHLMPGAREQAASWWIGTWWAGLALQIEQAVESWCSTCPPLTLPSVGMAIVPGICENCGAIFGSEVLTGAMGRDIRLGGARVGPCPSCGGVGRIPEGTYDLIDDTLRVVESAGIDKANLDGLIKLLEDRAAGRMTDREVIDQVEANAPELAPTVKGYLAKSDPASWLALLISILMMIQSASASPPSAEEIADAIWSKARSGAPAGLIPGESRANQTPRSPKTRADTGWTGSGRGQRQR